MSAGNETGNLSDLKTILRRVEDGDVQAEDELLPLVYEELRRMAAGKMSREMAGHTLQPTAFVR